MPAWLLGAAAFWVALGQTPQAWALSLALT